MKKKIACVIPARLKSTRFPRKVLAPLGGKPLVQWAWEAACSIPLFESVTIAVDADETAAIVQQFGGRYLMTAETCPSGTLRLCELMTDQKIDADIFVSWQADEPFLHQAMIENLLQSVHHDDANIWTLKKRISHPEEIESPHVVKVVTDSKGCALYFSRCPIPYHRSVNEAPYYKHIGIYAYTKSALLQIAKNPSCELADTEQLEQLNFLYRGLKIRVHETAFEGFGIDIPDHLAKAELLVTRK